jgi:hypothetical protein
MYKMNADASFDIPKKKEITTMETTFQPSIASFLKKMAFIEAIELSSIGFFLWGLFVLIPTDTQLSLLVVIVAFFLAEGFILGSWAIYLTYIRLTRGLYPRADVRLRFLIGILTSTYTFWAWIILDINRWILSKLIYRGEAPVEYAWSSKSKLIRKQWEAEQKARQVYTSL